LCTINLSARNVHNARSRRQARTVQNANPLEVPIDSVPGRSRSVEASLYPSIYLQKGFIFHWQTLANVWYHFERSVDAQQLSQYYGYLTTLSVSRLYSVE
jgi:hypothetical protein